HWSLLHSLQIFATVPATTLLSSLQHPVSPPHPPISSQASSTLVEELAPFYKDNLRCSLQLSLDGEHIFRVLQLLLSLERSFWYCQPYPDPLILPPSKSTKTRLNSSSYQRATRFTLPLQRGQNRPQNWTL